MVMMPVVLALVVAVISFLPDIKVGVYMLRHDITINDILSCKHMNDYAVANGECKSLEKYPEFLELLRNDKD